MANIAPHYFEGIVDGDTAHYNRIRQDPATQTQCLAAIVVLLAELVDEMKEQKKAFNPRQ